MAITVFIIYRFNKSCCTIGYAGGKVFTMIVSIKPCVNCGANKVSDFREYDGLLGYEAIICKKCAYIYDHSGTYAPDEKEIKIGGIDYRSKK